jgi:hypothetical protein
MTAKTKHPYAAEVAAILSALTAKGFALVSCDDGGEDIPVATEKEAQEVILSVDISHLWVKAPGVAEEINTRGVAISDYDGGKLRVIMIVLGNEPGVAISDYSVDPLLDEVAEEINTRFEEG